ncbi:tetratricopeptide repeat protein [candidate division KSB1 bacterium]|nr:tetratricopeptide repeat protein [candidate division KSB1 bacterium]
MLRKASKNNRQGQHGYEPILAKLAMLLKQVDRGTDAKAEELVDLTYSMEKLSRKFLADQDKQKGATYFKLAVENLRQFAQIKHDHAQELNLCYSAGQTYTLLGLMEEAVESYEQALKFSRKLNDYKSQARTLRQLGNLKLRQSEWKEAIACFEHSMKICQENGELLDEGYALNSLAAAYFHTAAWRKMENTCEHARAIAERMNDDDLTACVYNNLGAMHNMQGQFDKALMALQKSLPLFEKMGDLRGLAEAYNNMGTAYRDKEFWHEAGKYYATGFKFARQAGDALIEAQVSLNRVELYLLMHDLELAEKQCQIALRAFHGLGHIAGEADACRLLGVTYTRQESWGLAKRYLDEALQLCTQSSYPLGLAEAHKSYAEYWQAKGSKKLALKHLQKALERYKQLKAQREIKKLEKLLDSLNN